MTFVFVNEINASVTRNKGINNKMSNLFNLIRQ